MPTLKTRLSELLNVDLPIICAPMAGVEGIVDIAGAVSSAGGFGMMGAGFRTAQVLKDDIQSIRDRLKISAGEPVPIGIGFLGWVLDESTEEGRLEAVLEEMPVAVWLAFGVNMAPYVARIRAHDSKRAHKTVIFVLVNSVEMAIEAAKEWKVDVIVAQGIEAGGHGGANAPPLFSLLPAIIDAVPSRTLVVAAGGISNGRQIAALLALGADGVALGTKFLFTPECKYTSQKKEVLLQAGLSSTVHTLAYDEVGRTNRWPPGVDGHAVSNKVMDDLHEGLDLEERLKRFDESTAARDTSRLVVWAGSGVGLIDKISPAVEIIQDLRRETLATLSRTSKLI